MKATSALFSIALLTSSTLILNLDENIQVISGEVPLYLTFYPKEDDLQHLQFFTHYGKLVEQEQGARVFRSSSSSFGTGSSPMRNSLELREGLICSGTKPRSW